jgi:DNA mismatch endonuclease, patch repair protein
LVVVADYPHPSSAGRSANMRANRRTDTKPELALRRALHRLGYRYRKDYRLDLDGGRRVRPDIAFTGRKVAIFVDGCFWHACPEHGSKPRANEWYWGPKLQRNVDRDRLTDAALTAAGWTVVRLWEHLPLDEAVATVVTALAADRTTKAAQQRPHNKGRTKKAAQNKAAPKAARQETTRLPDPAHAPGCGRLWGTMRVFVPSTLPALARALEAGHLGPGPVPGFAVTPALREAYATGDEEELEYAALSEAARASLRLLADDPTAPSRRVVLAADIPDELLTWDAQDSEPGRVVIAEPVPITHLAAAHVDDPEAGQDVKHAAQALEAADAGDEDAQFTVDGAEGHELGWYARQELPYLAD